MGFFQVEGQNISCRRTDTMKQFPSAIFGYLRVGKRKDVKYKSNPKVENDLKSFFYEMTEVKKADDLFNILMKYKKTLKNKKYEDFLKYLKNPFYAAICRLLTVMKSFIMSSQLFHLKNILKFKY
jgi:site-specific DNA recombinase